MARVTGTLTGTTLATTAPPVRPPLLTHQVRSSGPPGVVFADFIPTKTAIYGPTLAFGQTSQLAVTVAGTYNWLCPAGITQIYVECFGGGGPGYGDTGGNAGYRGGGGGAFAARSAVPVTPGTIYTFTVGAGGTSPNGTIGPDGGDTTFTGDSSTQVLAKGGAAGNGQIGGGTGGAAASSVGDVGHVFSGGASDSGGGPPHNGGGGGASGNRVATGNAGSAAVGGAGANGGGSGGDGATISPSASHAGFSPGGGGGGGSSNVSARRGADGADGTVTISCGVVCDFIGSTTALYALSTFDTRTNVPFIGSTTAVHAPTLAAVEPVPFIASVTVVYPPALVGVAVDVPFIASKTHVWAIFALYDPNKTYLGSGNGGETFLIRLAANGTSATATLAANITDTATMLELTGDGGLPATEPFVAAIDSEIVYLVQVAPGSYRIRSRGVSNTTPAAHTAGATLTWGDSYDMALEATGNIDASFTADINSTGSFTYLGWLICFDSSQAYLAGARYPMHVGEVLGVFDAGAGSTGSSRLDAPQPNAVATPTGVSDDCPAALSVPALIQTDIVTGDVAVVRYTNPEASVLDLGPRSVSLESWFGLKGVDDTDHDITLTDPNRNVVDTTGGEGTYTGSVNDEWGNPIPLVTGIAPDASDAVGFAIDTPNPVAWTTVTLPGTDRFFTRGSGSGGYDEKGWPMCCLSVRQGNRRVPHWQSWDWHDYGFVYSGFGPDDTFAQLLINRNGIVFDSVPAVNYPGPQDTDGPDAVWDDATYFVGASWYVVIFGTPYIVFGPTIGGSLPPGGTGGGGTGGGFAPGVTFPPGGSPIITVPPTVEGGGGGDIMPGQSAGLFQAASV